MFDANNVDCSDRFRATRDDRNRSEGAIGELLPDRNTFARILPAGDYQLRMEFVGHGTCEQRVTIRERELTELRIRR